MKNIKKLLVTTDLSEASTAALIVAVEEAKRIGAKLVALSVVEEWTVPVQLYEFVPAETFDQFKDQVQAERLKELKKLVEQYAAGADVECRVTVSARFPVAQEIVEFAKSEGAERIVIATSGKGAVKHFLLGSVVEKVISLSEVPVLVVPSRKR